MENDTSSVDLLSAQTATGYSAAVKMRDVYRTFQAMGRTTASTGAATVLVQVSNKDAPVAATDVDWITLGTITLTLGTTQTSDGFASTASWRWCRAKLSAISGTNASVDVWAGA